MINDELKASIKAASFFSLFAESLTPETEKLFFESSTVITAKTGDFICKQGDPAKYLFFVLEGLLSIQISIPNKPSKELAKVYPGEPVGIYGLVLSIGYPGNLVALRYSKVLGLKKEYFEQHLSQNPKVLTYIINKLVNNTMLGVNQTLHHNIVTHIALLPANDDLELAQFYSKLQTALNQINHTEFFTSDDYQTPEDPVFSSLHQAGNNTQLKVFLLNPRNQMMTKFFLDRSDKIVLLGDGNSPPKLNLEATTILSETLLKRVLLLLYPEKTIPQHIAAWRTTSNYLRFHHLALNQPEDYQRIARFMQGKSITLVCGGGGTRGWVHMGVIKALLEAKIPIDAIGGTSIGAFATAAYLQNEDYDTAYKDAFDLTLDFAKLLNVSQFTFPALSLLTGATPTKRLKSIFKDRTIETLWKPFFCISCNLNTSQEYVHRTGLLWQAIRASISLPGLIPPMVIDGNSHVDGGIVNNLPVSHMREFLDETGTIIAVNLSTYQDQNQYDFPPEIGFIEAIKCKYQLGAKDRKIMELTEIISRASFAGAYLSLQSNAEKADILINPDLQHFSLLNETSPEKVATLVQIGYEAMKQKINLIPKS